MKKKVFGKNLSRSFDAKRALLKSLVKALVDNGEIETSKARAKAVRVDIDKLITKAKGGSVAEKRMVYSLVGNDRQVAEKLLKIIAPNFSDRNSGFVKLTKLGVRRGDQSVRVRLEWSKKFETEVDKSKKKKDKSSKGIARNKRARSTRKRNTRVNKKKDDKKK